MSALSPSLNIEPAVEIYNDPEFSLWPTLEAASRGHISLSGDLADEQIGSVVHAILHWFYYEEDQPAATIDEYLGRVGSRDAETTQVIVWGGQAFIDAANEVRMMPGCCVALGERDEVYDVLAERSPYAYLGHSPFISLAMDTDQVLLAQYDDDGHNLDTIECPRSQMDAALAVVESNIDSFLAALPVWAARHAPTHATELVEALAEGLRLPAPNDTETP